MRIATIFIAIGTLASAATIAPYPPSNFLLVTTSSRDFYKNYSLAPDVSATSLFDPFHQTDFYIRTTGPGYLSLPRFNLTSGSLQTVAEPFPNDEQLYGSVGVQVGEELILRPGGVKGGLSLKNGYLLSVGGSCEGWTLCSGTLEEEVIYWKGNDSSCVPRYVHAIRNAPY